MDDPLPKGLVEHIEKFFRQEHTRPPGRDIYPGIFASDLMFPLQRQQELVRMIQTARTINPTTIYEIGTDKGGGLYHWCKCFPDVKRIIACEIRGTPFSELFEQAFPHVEFLWLPVSSYDVEVVRRVKQWLGENTIDVLFIDGDKSMFQLDFTCYQPLMSKPGIVFMHDIQDPAPKEAFEAVYSKGYRTETIIDKSDTDIALGQEQAGLACSSSHEQWLRHWKGKSCGVGVIHNK